MLANKKLKIPESAILAAVLKILRYHPKVAMVWRANSGAYKTDAGRYIRFGFPGCSDILGILMGGRLLAVECKTVSGVLTKDQSAFLEAIRKAGGHAFVARSVDDVIRELG